MSFLPFLSYLDLNSLFFSFFISCFLLSYLPNLNAEEVPNKLGIKKSEVTSSKEEIISSNSKKEETHEKTTDSQDFFLAKEKPNNLLKNKPSDGNKNGDNPNSPSSSGSTSSSPSSSGSTSSSPSSSPSSISSELSNSSSKNQAKSSQSSDQNLLPSSPEQADHDEDGIHRNFIIQDTVKSPKDFIFWCKKAAQEGRFLIAIPEEPSTYLPGLSEKGKQYLTNHCYIVLCTPGIMCQSIPIYIRIMIYGVAIVPILDENNLEISWMPIFPNGDFMSHIIEEGAASDLNPSFFYGKFPHRSLQAL